MPPSRALVLAGLILAAVTAGSPAAARREREAEAPPPAWQALIDTRDRDRLRDWRRAWVEGLAQARAAGKASAIEAEGTLLQPDAALNQPALPDGDYRCRTIKLGAKPAGGTAFAVLPPAICRIADGKLLQRDGAQRLAGRLWSFDGVRLLFLGTMALGDERIAMPYGRDRERDMAGVLERIGDQRWRLVLPRPQWESQLDIVELVPDRP